MTSLQRRLLPLTSVALAGCVQLLASPAAAHIELQLPLNRYSNVKMGENKACPCGSGSTSRRCGPEDLSDDDRSVDRITTFAPGDTVTVRFDEYVGHDGRYRIAFDPDGADLEDFNRHILLDEPDPSGGAGNIGQGSTWEFQVTLPNMTCDNCTLQLIQVMDGNTVDPVLDPSTRGGTYFQCADIVLAEGTPAGGIPPANPGEHRAERQRPERTPSTTARPTDTAEPGETAAASEMELADMAVVAAPDSAGTPSSPTMSSSASSESACSLAPGRGASHGLAASALLVLSLAVLRRRLRSSGQSASRPA